MSKGNKTPAKSNKPKLALNLKKISAHRDTKTSIVNRNYKGRIL
ncbi:hypothetical protein PY092_12765 [Muricauda sp. 334s03]|uniref:Uncharacterized protein n=2 Tax=Flagellimonas TaxID=444459 RepID=A0ABT5XP85_9FLAO|nr:MULTISPECIES: hypothetical protein [Allomuricauda]MDF0707709.1 hypothetical protein [[Muricauda] okinawensis]MDF0717027.1 hypothetical protein [[Muricauda] yonaguniensis]